VAELVSGLAQEIVGAGIGTGIFSTSGTSVQVNFRRDMGADVTHVVLRQTGGLSFPHKAKEQQGIQVVVDSSTLAVAQAKARAVYELFEEIVATQISGGSELLWIRAVGPPQSLPTGPDASAERFMFSVNFEALLVKE